MNPFATLLRPAAALGAAAQNALEVARFGGLKTGEEASAYDIVVRTPMYRLRRYFAPQAGGEQSAGPPVLLVPPMMLAADVYDVSPRSSAVAALKTYGADPWVVDFGAPEHEEGGLERTLADHVVAVGACSIPSRPCASRSTSCSPCTTARRCCRASASASSSRRAVGSHGPARRWRTSSASSWRTTGCCRAAS